MKKLYDIKEIEGGVTTNSMIKTILLAIHILGLFSKVRHHTLILYNSLKNLFSIVTELAPGNFIMTYLSVNIMMRMC